MLAIVLMLAAPLLSRWQQARPGAGVAAAGALCTSRGLQALPALPTVAMSLHAGVRDDGGGMPHEPACDYCVLAARLLPLLALLLLVLPWLRQRATLAPPCPPLVGAGSWRAHAARGPPLFS